MSDDLTYRLTKLEPKPGDLLVFTTSRPLTRDGAIRVRETILRAVPGIQVLVCEADIDIALMPADELRKRLGIEPSNRQGDGTLESTSEPLS